MSADEYPVAGTPTGNSTLNNGGAYTGLGEKSSQVCI